MKQTWFVRQLVSYIPIFLLLTTVVTLITLLAIGEMSKKASWELNQAATAQLLQMVDRSLQDIEQMVIKETTDNSALVRFFHGTGDVLEESRAAETLQNWMVNNPLIHSAYLYRKSDDVVLNQSFRSRLAETADIDFLRRQASGPEGGPVVWTNPRIYRETAFQERNERVVSMVKRFPFPSGKLGVIVVNVKLADLDALIQPEVRSRTNFIRLYDSAGLPFGEPVGSDDQVLTEIRSGYTNWTIRSGLLNTSPLELSRAYVALAAATGLLAMLAGTLWVVYIARRSYKPIGSIMDRLHALRGLEVGRQAGGHVHELDAIRSALDQLIRQAVDYERVHEEDLQYRRRVFLHELLLGRRTIAGSAEWRREAEPLGLPAACASYQAALVEIDKYGDFAAKYGARDQNLLKFALGNIVKETAPGESGMIWPEWLEDRKLGLLYMVEGTEEGTDIGLQAACERICEYTRAFLKFTVTIGIGSACARPDLIARSLWQAERALNGKLVSGNGRVFPYRPTDESEFQQSMHDYFHRIEQLARAYRKDESDWRAQYDALFAAFGSAVPTHEEFATLVRLLITSLRRETMELPAEYQELWTGGTEPELNRIAGSFENIEELRLQFRDALESLEQRTKALRESRQYAALVQQVRAYIDVHFSDPDLSLAHLGDVFDISPKYLSYIFKEQLGVKFVDYLASVRLEHAKRLLVDCDDTIPSIAVRVGYLHAVSFNRVFKKIVGLTPGEYRNQAGNVCHPT